VITRVPFDALVTIPVPDVDSHLTSPLAYALPAIPKPVPPDSVLLCDGPVIGGAALACTATQALSISAVMHNSPAVTAARRGLLACPSFLPALLVDRS
jgi:hypothetical protein